MCHIAPRVCCATLFALSSIWHVLAADAVANRDVSGTSTTGEAPVDAAGAIPVAPMRIGGQIGNKTGSSLHSSIVVGTADVFGNGPYDLFVAPDRLFRFREFGDDGAPVYGEPETVQGDAVHDVLTGPGGRVYGVRASGRTVQLYEFDKRRLAFVPKSGSKRLDIPGSLGGGLAARIDGDGRLHVYSSIAGQSQYRPPGDHHAATYLPYDGAGFWRGKIPRRILYHICFDDLELKRVVSAERAGDGPGEFLFSVRAMTIVDVEESPALVTSEKQSVFRYFRIDEPSGAPGRQRFVNSEDRVALRHPAINTSAKAIPDPETGRANLIVGDSGRVWFYRFSGEFADNGSPIYESAQPVLAENAPLALGNLPVISAGDVDRDGLIDLIAGNNAGDLLFVKNVGRPTHSEFDNPVKVLVGGGPLDIKAGYRGSIQGPGEAMWGYTCPTLVDWDGDGRLDVILNSILADYMFLRQRNSKDGVEFDAPRNLYCDGLQLHLAWRCQPAIARWQEGDRLRLVALDEQNLLRFFWRIDDENVERGELLRLQDGSPITANVDEAAGQTGRAKLVAHDWDADGDMDLLIGTSRGLSFPASKEAYLPSHYGATRAASVLLLRNVGSNAEPVFDYVKQLGFQGERIRLGIHSCSPAPVDFGRGGSDLLVGEERGSIRFYPRESLSVLGVEH